jgi:hypothetical protein
MHERATERVAVLMAPKEQSTSADRASSMGLSLGRFFREAGAAYASRNADSCAEQALEAVLAELRAALQAAP